MYFSKITPPDPSSPVEWGRAKKEYNQENLGVKINNDNNNNNNDNVSDNNTSLIEKGQVEEERTKQNMTNDAKAVTHHFLWVDQRRTRSCANDS